MELLAFTLASVGILALPGPNVIVIASTSLAHGRLRGMQTVAGTCSGVALQLIVAAVGISWLAAALAEHFFWIKWLGIAYLIYLAIRQIRHMRDSVTVPLSSLGSFQRGFWIALSNPKTILFFSAFLPQFTVASEPYLPQIALLSAIIWIITLVRDSAYALFSDTLLGAFRLITGQQADTRREGRQAAGQGER